MAERAGVSLLPLGEDQDEGVPARRPQQDALTPTLSHGERERQLARWALPPVLLAAWALRLHDLTAQSLWYDEGTSAAIAPRAVPTILANAAADIHPPLYYLLLHAWAPLAGLGDDALRFPSAVVGLLTVAFVYRLGDELGGRALGLVAAVLAAGAPLLIWYGQEARMYALSTALGAGSSWLLARALRRPSRVVWIAYGASLAALLYSHYFAASIAAAQALAVVVICLATRRWRLLAAWANAAAAAGVVFLPWLLTTWGQLTGWPGQSPPYGLRELATRTLALIAQGQGGDRLGLAGALPLALLVVLGAVVLFARARVEAPLLLGAYAAVPLLLMFAVSLRRPFFHPKFVVLVAPAVELLAAAAIVGLLGRWRVLVVLATIALVAWRGPGVIAQWSDPRLARDDYRGLVRTIEAAERPGDVVVLDAPAQVEIVGHYYQGAAPLVPLPQTRPIDPAATAVRLESLLAEHPRFWLVLWATPESDPDSFVERWLDGHAYKAQNRWFGGVRLAEYLNPKLADLPLRRFEPRALFEGLGELASLELVDVQARAGEVLPIGIEWRAAGATAAPYKVFVHLIDDQEYLWGQRDAEPLSGARPTTDWRAGQTIQDRLGLPILPGTPPGDYMLEIGLYRADTGGRLPLATGGDRVLVGPIGVQPSAAGAPSPSPSHPLDASAGALRLLGFDLHPLGQDEAPPEVARGQAALLTLYWRALDRLDPPPAEVVLRLSGPAQVERHLPIGRGRYPADRWTPGEYVRDPYKLVTDDLPPGAYDVQLVAPLAASLGRLVVR